MITLNDNTPFQISKQWQVQSKNLVANRLPMCHVKLWFRAAEFGIFILLAHCPGPRKWVGWVPFFFIQRCHRLIVKTSFHLHNRMGSDSLLSYYLQFGTLCWKVIAFIQKRSVRNSEQWEFDIFLLLPPEENQSNYLITFMYFIKECGVIFKCQQTSWKWQNSAARLSGHSH